MKGGEAEVFTKKSASRGDRLEHKRLVKAEKQENRKNKIKKHLKKKLTKGAR